MNEIKNIKEIKTITRPIVSTSSFDEAVNKAINEGFRLVKIDCKHESNILMAVLGK